MGDDTPATSGDWSSWVQSVMGGVISKASDAKWVQPYNVEQMRLQQLGPGGYYNEGQRTLPGGAAAAPGFLYGINQGTLLLIGAAVVGLMLLRK